ncbi:exonuclease RecJ [Moraxella cuniculi DSM 21768]|uniref:Single-stranded-DNA-specific exonuclease RecJ n=1 Tax=Moraxella cuniculi DSM 21768 TaxID=1122245 RepID=A0A1N7F6D5_9GAMM|nr:single-stranded-DNA-specific exonuclease RecJ [Moraxella cuniculi]OOS06440.1 single-stranded-DNA-specific exonuclease RecJ [Moraxella cuniculi]SIR95937.1 exonuclease RecJ [Moraxella cuniculi DSM 21768]
MTRLTLSPRLTETLAESLAQAVGYRSLARVLQARKVADVADLTVGVSALLPAADLLGIDDAVSLIDAAIDRGDNILIIGDFDCDGATSTALMMRVLRQMGAVVDFLVPDRFKFGYGLTPEIVDYGVQLYQPKLIITVDNGISSHEGVARAHQLGVQVVITDHHLTTKPSPPADAVVNPNQLGCSFASKSLVGVGVAFYVMGRLAKHRRNQGKSTDNVARYLDLVALGTVADLGVFDRNNRILVTHGLARIREGKCVLGILAILEQAGRSYQTMGSEDFGFAIAPRINAAGRMDNMRIGVECLLADDWGEAHRLAMELNRLNQARRTVEISMKDEAVAIIDTLQLDSKQTRATVLYQDNWHQGVIGIVAGRLKEKLYRPSIVFAPADTQATADDDLIKGSARSIAGVHIRDVIEAVAIANPTLIEHFGGHAMAAGLTIKKANFEPFAKAFLEQMATFDEAIFCEQKFTDGELEPNEFSLQFADTLKNISVWGNGFLPPVFDGEFVVMNHRILKDKHLKLTLKLAGVQYPIDAIWFNYQPKNWDYRASSVHILYTLDINQWQGGQSLQLVIKDLAVVQIAALQQGVY